MTTTKLYDDTVFTTTTQTLTGPMNVTVEQDAFVFVASDAFSLHGGGWTFKLDGTIQAANSGIGFIGDNSNTLAKNSHLNIGTEGTIVAGTVAVYANLALDMSNAGLIHGGYYGFYAADVGPTASKGFTITNTASGIIDEHEVAIYNGNADWALTVKNQGIIEGNIVGIEWAGAATITNSGTISGYVQTTGSDATKSSITNSGTIDSGIFLDGDDAMLKNGGSIQDAVALLATKNSFTNSGEIHAGATFGFVGASSTTFMNSGDIDGNVQIFGGTDKVTNSGTIHGQFIGSPDGNIITNSGVITGLINLGNGDDIFTNSGKLSDRINTGDGDDVFKDTGSGSVGIYIDLGSGNDTLIGGNARESVHDNTDDDVYKLGGGDDLLAIRSGNDTADGGAGFDGLEVDTVNACKVNLDTKAVTLNGLTLLAASVDYTGGHVAIKGFESVFGGDADDLIAGSSGKDTLNGADGNDHLAGGLGADTLIGGAGNDVFTLLQAKDSGTTRATRDVIQDFQGAGATVGDLIDLGAVDANTNSVGDQGFTSFITDGVFTKTAGELRVIHDGVDTIVQGDINGDGKADFSIDVVGTQNLTAADFTL